MSDRFIVYRLETDLEGYSRVEDVTFHRSYDAAAKEIKRRMKIYRLKGDRRENDWIGIRRVYQRNEVT